MRVIVGTRCRKLLHRTMVKATLAGAEQWSGQPRPVQNKTGCLVQGTSQGQCQFHHQSSGTLRHTCRQTHRRHARHAHRHTHACSLHSTHTNIIPTPTNRHTHTHKPDAHTPSHPRPFFECCFGPEDGFFKLCSIPFIDVR